MILMMVRLKMLDDLRIESNGIKKYAEDENQSSWKITLDYFLSGEGGSSSSIVISIHENFQFTFRIFIKNV